MLPIEHGLHGSGKTSDKDKIRAASTLTEEPETKGKHKANPSVESPQLNQPSSSTSHSMRSDPIGDYRNLPPRRRTPPVRKDVRAASELPSRKEPKDVKSPTKEKPPKRGGRR